MHKRDLHGDPFSVFRRWFEAAEQSGEPMANAMTLATASADGMPSARMVLLKGIDDRGFLFYTNYESRKAQDLLANPRAALVFWWQIQRRQVRIGGSVEKISEAESLAYFQSRPRTSQLGAWTSPQSKEIPGRNYLLKKFSEMERRFGEDPIPCPQFWGGYRLIPDRFEFWQENESRLHDRFELLPEDKTWRIRRLGP
nr:pyridoxamine 5'-phosphate oxidase [Acanthopleuribacter pedis]